MKTSYEIKEELLTAFINNLELKLNAEANLSDSSDNTTVTIEDYKKNPDNAIVRGYAAVLLSITNYGFNVANRRPLPNFAYPNKETGLMPFTHNTTGKLMPALDQEGSYIRPSKSHPSRRNIEKLIRTLENQQEDGEFKKLIATLKASRIPGDGETWLGQWKLPEEVFEEIFSQLRLKTVQKICLDIAKTELTELTNSKNILKEILGKPKREEELFEEPQSTMSLTKSPSSMSNNIVFDTVMNKRIEIVRKIADKITSDNLLPVKAPKTDYPCVMFDLRPLAVECGVAYEDMKDPSKVLVAFNLCIMSYFIGLINHHSMRRYGPNFVWVQEQSSFGSLRPSFSDTGRTFRFSPGLVPDDFYKVVAAAYKSLIEELKEPVVLEKFKTMVKTSIKGEGEKQTLKKKKLLYFFSKSNTWRRETAQLLALKMKSCGEDKKSSDEEHKTSPFLLYIKKIPSLNRQIGKFTQAKQKLKERKENFEEASKSNITDVKEKNFKNAESPEILVNLLHRIEDLVRSLKKTTVPVTFCLVPSAEKHLLS